MSDHSLSRDADAASALHADDGDRRESSGVLVPEPVSFIAFWSAIGLPALYLPLLVAGLGTTADLVAFLGMLGLHVVLLVVGRTHRPG